MNANPSLFVVLQQLPVLSLLSGAELQPEQTRNLFARVAPPKLRVAVRFSAAQLYEPKARGIRLEGDLKSRTRSASIWTEPAAKTRWKNVVVLSLVANNAYGDLHEVGLTEPPVGRDVDRPRGNFRLQFAVP